MHELSLMESLVEAVQSSVRDARVVTVRLEVGQLTCVSVAALRFCFEVCTQGTAIEGAELEILEIPARGRCRSCGRDGLVHGPIPTCRCGSFDLLLHTGNELRLKELEVL